MKVGSRVLDEDGRVGIVIDVSADDAGILVAHVEYVDGSTEGEAHTAWIACDQLIEVG